MGARSAPRPQKTAMLVAQRIVADINRRGNQVGERLPPERAMLEQYQVGRGTLRESLRYLELQGVISLRPGPGGGPVVERPDSSSLSAALSLLLQFADASHRAIADARATVETLTARLAAEQMSDDALAELRESVETMHEQMDDELVFLEENRRFHVLIAHSSGNPVFGYLVEALLDILAASALGIEFPGRRREEVYGAHTTICAAIAAHDGDAAARAMADHIDEYVRYAQEKYPEVLDAPITWTA
ncbi:FadR/GntR family transcriptional regulator [Aeromicrobium phragmitis]|nr:FCD domain-containing protein [Aeromicrobium phragmitis]